MLGYLHIYTSIVEQELSVVVSKCFSHSLVKVPACPVQVSRDAMLQNICQQLKRSQVFTLLRGTVVRIF